MKETEGFEWTICLGQLHPPFHISFVSSLSTYLHCLLQVILKMPDSPFIWSSVGCLLEICTQEVAMLYNTGLADNVFSKQIKVITY